MGSDGILIFSTFNHYLIHVFCARYGQEDMLVAIFVHCGNNCVFAYLVSYAFEKFMLVEIHGRVSNKYEALIEIYVLINIK